MKPAPDEHSNPSGYRRSGERGAPAGGAGKGNAVRQGGGRTHEPPQPAPPEAIVCLS